MKLILSESHDPAVNLAAEEYLLESKKNGDYMMLWTSEPSVIIGKFQNPYAEVSLTECEKAGVKIFRRNSGGGTVYHDRGNLNYTVISDKSENSPDYSRFLTPIVDFLARYGVSAEITDTSALFTGGKKISGNAQSVSGGRVMHHGTLLFDADLTALDTLTGHAREKILTKSIKSNPSPVTNIRPLMSCDMDTVSFAYELGTGMCDEVCTFSPEETAEINTVAAEKYRSWKWIFGRSPAFRLERDGFSINSSHGIIESCSEYEDLLKGAKLIPDEITERLGVSATEADTRRIMKIIFD